MNKIEYDFYEKIKDWDFSHIKYEEEILTKWDEFRILEELSNAESKVLDLGTGGGERVLKRFPKVKEILATDFSKEMVKNANENLKKSKKKNIKFAIMDNLKMTTEADYYDIVVARNTVTDPKQIYKTLKQDGYLIIHGVDKLDCWELKRLFNQGQGYKDTKPISLIDYENILDAGFKEVELVPIHVREYYKTKEDLLALLYKTPILDDFSEENLTHKDDYYKKNIDENLINEYINKHTYSKGILLIRRYYGITAKK